MSLSQILVLISIFLLDFPIGLLLIIWAKPINNWLFDWSNRMLKGSYDTPYTKGERLMSLWTLRVVGILLMSLVAASLYSFFISS
jgi:hypothetical protein